MITYHELGATKRLNEITIAGAHDAGVKDGAWFVRTQKFDIFRQAMEGVRVFDIRIAAQSTAGAPGQPRQATLKAFHSSIAMGKTKTRFSPDVGRMEPVKRAKLVGGAFGDSLANMLNDARDFVENFAPNEFLILKFDKCANWSLIAETCIERLGGAIFRGQRNLNTATLDDLKGKVIVVFSKAGHKELGMQPPPGGQSWKAAGILGFKNLSSSGESYEADYAGLQYYGKGGTNVVNPFFKVRENISRQRSKLQGAKKSHPDTVSMMYWTTTGFLGSIKFRNDRMWDAPNVHRMKKLWASGLREHVEQRFVRWDTDGVALMGMQRRIHMPNIIMIDFAESDKCRVIRELNDMTEQQIAALQ